MKLAFTLFVLVISQYAIADNDFKVDSYESKLGKVRVFQYDGCSLFPEGTRKQPKLWDHCCLEHDLFYWAGGNKKQRLHADQNLRQCFRDVGQETLAELVYIAVRTGRFYPFRFRSQQWGNAWHVTRNYRQLSDEDVQLILEALADMDVPQVMKERLIDSLLD